MVSGSQDSPPIEGQFIIYTCPPGLVLTGLNASACTGNGEWEPDPGDVACIGAQYGTQLYYYHFSDAIQLLLLLLCRHNFEHN